MQNGSNGSNGNNKSQSTLSNQNSQISKPEAKSTQGLETKAGGSTETKANDSATSRSNSAISSQQGLQSQNFQKNDTNSNSEVNAKDGAKDGFDLQSILPEFSKEDLTRYRQKVLQYAEEKPMQTVGWAVAGGALLGWLLISKQGQAVMRTAASIAVPLVTAVISHNGGFQQIGSQIAGQQPAVTHH